MLLAQTGQLLEVRRAVVLAREDRRVLRVGELWVALAAQAPSFPIRQVQVQGVDLVLGEEADLLLQFVHGYEGVAEPEHQASHAEGGPVDDIARLQFALPVGREDELLEGLKASI